MAVRSTPLQQVFAATTNSPQAFIAGLSGRTKILKHLALNNTAASDRRARIYLNGTSSSDKLVDELIPAGTAVQIKDLFIVIIEGDLLYADQNGAGVFLSAFGANLLGDPS